MCLSSPANFVELTTCLELRRIYHSRHHRDWHKQHLLQHLLSKVCSTRLPVQAGCIGVRYRMPTVGTTGLPVDAAMRSPRKIPPCRRCALLYVLRIRSHTVCRMPTNIPEEKNKKTSALSPFTPLTTFLDKLNQRYLTMIKTIFTFLMLLGLTMARRMPTPACDGPDMKKMGT
jgi:hypothetical protein